MRELGEKGEPGEAHGKPREHEEARKKNRENRFTNLNSTPADTFHQYRLLTLECFHDIVRKVESEPTKISKNYICPYSLLITVNVS